MHKQELRVSSPGRMCLLGEHQDYFGLAIIAAAIDLRITFAGTDRSSTAYMNYAMDAARSAVDEQLNRA